MDDLIQANARLTEERDNLSAALRRALIEKGELMVRVSQMTDNERPCRFMPGDRVIALADGKMFGGVVQKVAIPGPEREDKTICVWIEDDDMRKVLSPWFNHEHVERLGA